MLGYCCPGQTSSETLGGSLSRGPRGERLRWPWCWLRWLGGGGHLPHVGHLCPHHTHCRTVGNEDASKQAVSPFVTFRPCSLHLFWSGASPLPICTAFFSGLFWGISPRVAPSLLRHQAPDGFFTICGGFVMKRGLPTAQVGSWLLSGCVIEGHLLHLCVSPCPLS